MKCNLEGCHRTFRKYAVFRNHIYNYHSNKLEDAGRADILDPDTACTTSETSHAIDPTFISEDESLGMDDLDNGFVELISNYTFHFYATSSSYMGAKNTGSKATSSVHYRRNNARCWCSV